MKDYGLPTDQVEKYGKSYHAQIMRGEIPGKNPALAPTCASCHSHSPLRLMSRKGLRRIQDGAADTNPS